MKTMQIPNKVRQIIGMAAMVFCALGAGVAQAADPTLTYVDIPHKYEPELLQYGNFQRNTNTGAYQVKEGVNGVPFWIYCLDPLTYFQSSNNYGTSNLSTFITGGAYATLFAADGYINSSVNDGIGSTVPNDYGKSNTTPATVLDKLTELYSHAYFDSLTSNDKSGAFQYAIWEIEGDTAGAYSSTAGGLRFVGTGNNADPSFVNQVNIYLKALNAGTGGTWADIGLGATNNFTYTVYNSVRLGDSQTVLKVTPNAVPEPASVVLFGIGILALGASRRGTRKQVSTS